MILYIIILIIIIICYFYLTKKYKLWNELPISKKNIKNDGYITNHFKLKEFSNRFKIYQFSPNTQLNDIIHFINKNSNILTKINIDVDI